MRPAESIAFLATFVTLDSEMCIRDRQEVVRLRNQEYLTGYEEGNDDIAPRIDAAIADDDMYEPGEPRPSLDAAARAKDLINSAGDAVRGVPCPEVSVYFGEIDVTWRVRNRLLSCLLYTSRCV